MSLNQQQITDLLQQHFPQIQDEISIDSLNDQEATVRLSVNNRHLRPGNTVSGPSMFLLADVAAYIAILAQVGARTQAVTTSAHMDFLRKPQAHADIIATTKVLKSDPQGIERLREYVRQAGETPVVAIGGIDLDNAAEVLATGAASLAVVRAVTEAEHPEAVVKAFQALWG